MSGPPVVIAENGLGTPVQPVESGAPVLTVAENGIGAPIVISDRGQPFVVEGLGPPNPITGTGPTLAALTDGDTLSSAVTWGSYEPEGATPDRQMRVDAGAWVAYDGDTEVAEGEVWRVREVVSFEDFTRTFASATQEVQPIPPEYERTAFTATTRSMHSGHSLTDAYFYGNGWPGDLVRLRNSLMGPEQEGNGPYLFRSTVPGSSIQYRWEYNTEAKTDIDDFDALMITEGGPPEHLFDPRDVAYIDASFDHLLRFCANTIENGAGNEIILWSIWPAWDMWAESEEAYVQPWKDISFPEALVEYGEVYETMAEYATFKMHDLYTLPEDWKVWLVPGHRWWLRVYNDIQNNDVPTITDISDLFDDDIHPDARAAYGLACFATACLYQIDLREQTGVYIPDGLNADLREYFWQIAWEIATDYAGVGMGGTSEDGSQWDGSTDPDFMPDWELSDPDTSPGWVVMMPIPIPENTVAPAFSGALEDGETIALGNGSWSPTPDEIEKEIYADAVLESTNGSLDLTGREGEEITGRVRARMTNGAWSDWELATGGGEVQPVAPPAGVTVTRLGSLSFTNDDWPPPVSLNDSFDIGAGAGEVFVMVAASSSGVSGVSVDLAAATKLHNWFDGDGTDISIWRVTPTGTGAVTVSITAAAYIDNATAQFYRVAGAGAVEDTADWDSAGIGGWPDYEKTVAIDTVEDGVTFAVTSSFSNGATFVGFTVNEDATLSGNRNVSGYRLETATETGSITAQMMNFNRGGVAVSLAPE